MAFCKKVFNFLATEKNNTCYNNNSSQTLVLPKFFRISEESKTFDPKN